VTLCRARMRLCFLIVVSADEYLIAGRGPFQSLLCVLFHCFICPVCSFKCARFHLEKMMSV
jgi:hypothetical protein